MAVLTGLSILWPWSGCGWMAADRRGSWSKRSFVERRSDLPCDFLKPPSLVNYFEFSPRDSFIRYQLKRILSAKLGLRIRVALGTCPMADVTDWLRSNRLIKPSRKTGGLFINELVW